MKVAMISRRVVAGNRSLLALAALGLLTPVAVAQQNVAKTLEAEIVRLTNVERSKHGLRTVQSNVKLRTAAVEHTANMARQNQLSHTLDGKDPGRRLRDAGYDWRTYGENIAYGYTDAQAVVQGWMKSPKHRDNILNPHVTEIGVGVLKNAQGKQYYCQVFAQPRATVGSGGARQDLDTKSASPTAATAPMTGGPMAVAASSSALQELELEIVRLTNLEREKNGVRPVQLNTRLTNAATGHAANMA